MLIASRGVSSTYLWPLLELCRALHCPGFDRNRLHDTLMRELEMLLTEASALIRTEPRNWCNATSTCLEIAAAENRGGVTMHSFQANGPVRSLSGVSHQAERRKWYKYTAFPRCQSATFIPLFEATSLRVVESCTSIH